MTVMNTAALFGAFGYLWAQSIARGGLSLAAFLGGFVFMVMLQLIIKHAGQAWLKEWALSAAIIVGMVTVGFVYSYWGTGG